MDPSFSAYSLASSACFFYDGWNLLEEIQVSGLTSQVSAYVHGPRTDELVAKITATNTVYYHADVLGNVTHLTDESGNVVEQYKYDVFGNPTILSPVSGVLSSSAYGNRDNVRFLSHFQVGRSPGSWWLGKQQPNHRRDGHGEDGSGKA